MIYADFNGSAPMHPKVREYLSNRILNGPYANPNAIHSLGKKMSLGLEKARMSIAKNLGARSHHIVYNSGASEGITQVYRSLLDENPKRVIISSGIEHSAVVEANNFYAARGFEVYKVNVDSDGLVDMQNFKDLFEKHQANLGLVSIMAANNETGVIQPIKEIGEICQKGKVPFFSDTTQYIGKIDFDFSKLPLDYAVMSGHKIGAIVGSGLLLAKDTTTLKPLIFGGGQEGGLRGGTQNYIGAETMAIALQAFQDEKEALSSIQSVKINFEQKLKAKFPDLVILGEQAPRLACSSLISYPGIHGQAVQIELESQDIFVTTSSACSDNEPETSKVLRAMGVDDRVGRGVIRISFCTKANQGHYDQLYNALESIYRKLGKISA